MAKFSNTQGQVKTVTITREETYFPISKNELELVINSSGTFGILSDICITFGGILLGLTPFLYTETNESIFSTVLFILVSILILIIGFYTRYKQKKCFNDLLKPMTTRDDSENASVNTVSTEKLC